MDDWDSDAREWRESVRGSYLGYDAGTGLDVWRQFCAKCNAPILATRPYKDRADMTCDLCAVRSGNTIAGTAFGPVRRLST